MEGKIVEFRLTGHVKTSEHTETDRNQIISVAEASRAEGWKCDGTLDITADFRALNPGKKITNEDMDVWMNFVYAERDTVVYREAGSGVRLEAQVSTKVLSYGQRLMTKERLGTLLKSMNHTAPNSLFRTYEKNGLVYRIICGNTIEELRLLRDWVDPDSRNETGKKTAE